MRVQMRGLGLALLVAVAGCSSGDVASVTFTHPQEGAGEVGVTVMASGEAVDQGLVCSESTQSTPRLYDMSGEEIYESDWFEMFDAAMDAGTVAEMIDRRVWTCSDGSGSFEMAHETRIDFSSFDLEGQQDVGRWKIEGGTGSYSGLSGSGDVVLDFATETVTFTGEIQGGS